jgi:triosephosphate isomerase
LSGWNRIEKSHEQICHRYPELVASETAVGEAFQPRLQSGLESPSYPKIGIGSSFLLGEEENGLMRKKIVAGNWKMNNAGPKAAVELAEAVVADFAKETAVDVVLCPPFTALAAVAQVVEGTRVALGAQNLYPKDSGAYTGEIDPNALLEIGCHYVILGHSERRQYFKESDEFINEKVRIALDRGLIPIMCCGETMDERKQGLTHDVVRRHVERGLADIRPEDLAKVVIAYEPVWAIGTGLTAKPEDAEEVHAFIRNLLAEKNGKQLAETIRIQYGGSVKPDNAKELFSQLNIDGGLIGGASLKADQFKAIIEAGSR